jgi:N-acetylmuramoyl-L-alanine amidase
LPNVTRARQFWRAAALVAGIALPASACAATVTGVRFGGDAAATRIVVDLDGPASPIVVPGGASLELDVRSSLAEGLQGGRGRGLVKAWSIEAGSRGERLRFDLAGDAKVARRFMIPPSEAAPGYRYVLDLAPTVAQAPVPVVYAVSPIAYEAPRPVRAEPAFDSLPDIDAALPVRAVSRPAKPVAVTRVRAERRLKVVVIDPGHGGHDSGALGANRQEKDLTLAAAEALEAKLERSGHYRVILTRNSDVFIPLETRVKIARDGGADLFISLHADSAGGVAATHGASVYTLSDSGGGRVHSVLGRNEWFSKVANRGDAGTSQILLDLTQRSTRNRSATFAELLLDRLAGKVDLLPRGHRDAGYFVLLAPDVPAALLEMGFITNPDDERRLADPTERTRMMDSVAEAIDDYFAEGRKVASE